MARNLRQSRNQIDFLHVLPLLFHQQGKEMIKNDKEKPYVLPLSGQIIGDLFETLRIPYPEHLAKEMQRYFRGERIHDECKQQIFYSLADALLEDGILPHPPVFDKAYLCPWGVKIQVKRAISEYVKRWDSLRERTSHWVIPPSRKKELLITCFRMVTIDLALRLAAFRYLSKSPHLRRGTPTWIQHRGNALYLKQLMDKYQGTGNKREELIAATGVVNEKTIEGWFERGKRPSDEHLELLAKALAGRIPGVTQEELLNDVRRQYFFTDLCDRIADRIGMDELNNLVAALFHYTASLQRFFELDPQPVEENYSHYLLYIITGAGLQWEAPPFKHLWVTESDPEWKRDLIFVGRDWVPRLIQRNLRFTGESVVSRQDNSKYFPNNYNTVSASFDYVSATYNDHMVDGEMALWGGAGNEAYQWDEKTEAALRHSVRINPSRARAHLSLGVYLGFNTNLQKKIEEGLQECFKAVELRSTWDLPRIEIAHILMRYNRYEEAVSYLDEAAKELPRLSAKFCNTTGFSRMMNHDPAGALTMFEKAISLKPDYALALDNASYCSFLLGDKINGKGYAKSARLLGVSTTYDQFDVGKLMQTPRDPFQTLCETVGCQNVNCVGRDKIEETKERLQNL